MKHVVSYASWVLNAHEHAQDPKTMQIRTLQSSVLSNASLGNSRLHVLTPSALKQNADEVFIRVPVAESVRGKFEVHPKRLSLHVDGNSMLEGSLEDVGSIKLDGCFWTMEDEGQARHVLVTLAKMNKGDQDWDGLLEEETADETIIYKYKAAYPNAPASHYQALFECETKSEQMAMMTPSPGGGSPQYHPVAWLLPEGVELPGGQSAAASSAAGDVFYAPPSIYAERFRGYSQPLRASFSNMSNAVIPLQLTPGDTHVAVGFVDLASLLTAELAASDCPPGSSTPPSSGQAAAKFVGFDSSAYTMAATESVDIDSIIRALADFSRTIDMLMQLPEERSGHGSHEDQRASPSFLPAGFATTTLTPEVLQDRVSFAHYLLTGELPVGSKGTVGSILMLAGTPFKSMKMSEIRDLMLDIADGGIHPVLPRTSDEIFHHLLPMYQIILPKAGGGAGEANGALMDECVEFTCGTLRKLRGWLVSERLSVSLIHATFHPEAAALLSSVQSMAPTSIIWSNILDYMPPADFHRMARLCSCPKAAPTKHYITTMNWVQSVYGMCPSELPVPERKAIYAAGIRRISQRLEVEEPSGCMVRGFDDTHISFVWEYEQSFSLAPAWVRHFCSQDEQPGRVSVHRLAKGTCGEFSRNASTVHLLLSYANEEAAEERPLELPPWG
eukprot:gene13479-19338_t